MCVCVCVCVLYRPINYIIYISYSSKKWGSNCLILKITVKINIIKINLFIFEFACSDKKIKYNKVRKMYNESKYKYWQHFSTK